MARSFVVGRSQEKGDETQEAIKDNGAKTHQATTRHYHGPKNRRNHVATQNAIQLERLFTEGRINTVLFMCVIYVLLVKHTPNAREPTTMASLTFMESHT